MSYQQILNIPLRHLLYLRHQCSQKTTKSSTTLEPRMNRQSKVTGQKKGKFFTTPTSICLTAPTFKNSSISSLPLLKELSNNLAENGKSRQTCCTILTSIAIAYLWIWWNYGWVYILSPTHFDPQKLKYPLLILNLLNGLKNGQKKKSKDRIRNLKCIRHLHHSKLFVLVFTWQRVKYGRTYL